MASLQVGEVAEDVEVIEATPLDQLHAPVHLELQHPLVIDQGILRKSSGAYCLRRRGVSLALDIVAADE
jgi:hypothetical protein